MIKKLQEIIRVRMNSWKMLDMKFIKDLKNLESIEKRFESMIRILGTV